MKVMRLKVTVLPLKDEKWVTGHQEPSPVPLGAGEHIGKTGVGDRRKQGLAWGTEPPEHRVGFCLALARLGPALQSAISSPEEP